MLKELLYRKLLSSQELHRYLFSSIYLWTACYAWPLDHCCKVFSILSEKFNLPAFSSIGNSKLLLHACGVFWTKQVLYSPGCCLWNNQSTGSRGKSIHMRSWNFGIKRVGVSANTVFIMQLSWIKVSTVLKYLEEACRYKEQSPKKTSSS